MKRFLYIIIGVAFLFTSCDKEDAVSGHLDGFWQLTEMSSSKATSADMRSSGITWAFQGHILELRDLKTGNQDIVMSFERNGDMLKVYSPYLVDRDADDVLLPDADLLTPYGITHTSETFDIIELSSSRLVLDNADMHLEFRKY